MSNEPNEPNEPKTSEETPSSYVARGEVFAATTPDEDRSKSRPARPAGGGDFRREGRDGGRDGGGGRGAGGGGRKAFGPGGTRRRKKPCPFCKGKETFDYKAADRLRRYLSDRGKILPRRAVGTCALHQRTLTKLIRRARTMALLPYSSEFDGKETRDYRDHREHREHREPRERR